jgi:pimeloyl-ACP methyl ester carboxylesterase
MTILPVAATVPPGPVGVEAAAQVARLDAMADILRTSLPTGGDIVWRSWGRGFPLVLIHGGSGAWNHWIRNIPVLAEHYRVIAPDLPGLGDSDALVPAGTPDSVGDCLALGLDAMGVSDGYSLAGFSFGGLIAGVLASRRAKGLHSLALLGPTGLGLPLHHLVELKKPDFSAPATEQAEIQRHNLLQIMIADPLSVDALALYVQSENTRRARLVSHVFALDDTCARAISTLTCPVASFWGADDIAKVYFAERRALFAELKPGGPFYIVPRAGHWAQYEAPNAFNRLFLCWLAKTIRLS